MRKLSIAILIGFALISTISTAFAIQRWKGSTIKFNVVNNTAHTLTIGPAWNGEVTTMPHFSFPEGSTIAPHSYFTYLIGAPNLAQPYLGTLLTGVFIGSTLNQACSTHIQLTENTDGTLTMNSYEMDHFFVATTNPTYSCVGQPINFYNGTLNLVINRSS